MTRVTLDGLSYRHAGAKTPAVEALTLEAPSGALTALLGPSGSGKTTAMKLIAGLLPPMAGDVAFDGRSVAGVKPEARGAVMMFQNHLLFPSMNVGENIGFGLRMRGAPKAEIAAQVTAMLARVRLPGIEDRRPQDLSGGQQQRVALARALVVAPRVLLLDEPLSNLDADLREEMGDLIRGLQREMGLTTILVTHDRDEAVALSDRIALLREGRLAQAGTPRDLHDRPRDEATARFFGRRNFLDGVAADGVFTGAFGALTLPPGAAEGREAVSARLTFRPEAARIGPRAGGPNTLRATVATATWLSGQVRLTARLDGAEGPGAPIEIRAYPEDAAGLEAGRSFAFTLPPDALWVVTC